MALLLYHIPWKGLFATPEIGLQSLLVLLSTTPDQRLRSLSAFSAPLRTLVCSSRLMFLLYTTPDICLQFSFVRFFQAALIARKTRLQLP